MRRVEDGHLAPARCRANICDECIVVNARAIALALALAQPTRAIRFSLVGDDWQTARARIARVRYDMVDAGYAVQWAWHREPNPAGTGHHVHAWQRGDYVPQRALQRICERRGLGIPYIERLKQSTSDRRGIGYGLKGIRYGLKGAESTEQRATYLAVNGGRLVHASRGWWLDRAGAPCGQREAMRAATRSVEPDGTWTLVRVSDLERAAEGWSSGDVISRG